MKQDIGSNPLPIDAQMRVAELCNFLSGRYDIPNGDTAMFWALSFEISRHIGEPLK